MISLPWRYCLAGPRTSLTGALSSCCKRLLYYCCFRRPQGSMQDLMDNQFVMISTWGRTESPSCTTNTNRPCSPPSAEQVYGWITRHLPDGPKPPIYRPFNYVRIVAVTTSILGVITFLSVASPYILPVIQNRNLWAAISLIIILLFTSGHMFNHIRKVPYVAGDGKGGINYFAGGFSSQFGLETQIVAAMCTFNQNSSPCKSH